jgi:membrane-associated phospholipid phosphatase
VSTAGSTGSGDLGVPRLAVGLEDPAPTPVPEAIRRFDRTTERWASLLRRRPWADRLAYALSELGNHSAIWHALNLADAVLGPALSGDPTRRRRAVRRSVIQGVEQAIINGPTKMLFRRERPAPLDDHPHDLRHPRTSSFPSGHASAGGCAATLLSRDLGHAPAWFSLAAAIGWSRVHVGVHHPSDVVGGMVMGIGLASIAERAWSMDGTFGGTPAR